MNFRWYIVNVYTCKNSKVRLMKSFNNCATANGAYYFYVCPRKHIHNNFSSGFVSEQTVYKVGSKVKEFLHIQYDDYSVYSARKNGSSTAMSMTQFQMLTSGCRSILVEYSYTNTDSNRTKLIKGKCKVNK